jgi:hypothetical protein
VAVIADLLGFTLFEKSASRLCSNCQVGSPSRDGPLHADELHSSGQAKAHIIGQSHGDDHYSLLRQIHNLPLVN